MIYALILYGIAQAFDGYTIARLVDRGELFKMPMLEWLFSKFSPSWMKTKLISANACVPVMIVLLGLLVNSATVVGCLGLVMLIAAFHQWGGQ